MPSNGEPASFHLTGLISSSFVILSLSGIALQLLFVWRRKREFRDSLLVDETPTSVLSLNRFATSFVAFFAMFLYGLSLEELNHYLVWPRVIAVILLLAILYEIQQDRKTLLSRITFWFCFLAALVSVVLAFTEYRVVSFQFGISHWLVVAASCLLLQGALHQIVKIRRTGRTGALSLKMHQLFFLKDVSSITFGVVMGVDIGWPVVLIHAASLLVQVSTMWHFYWVRSSAVAELRRHGSIISHVK